MAVSRTHPRRRQNTKRFAFEEALFTKRKIDEKKS
jgi:hypothetical protein